MSGGNRLVARLARMRAANERGVSPYVTAGDGGAETTLAVLRALDAAGATCVELGLPFSDPIADGPTLQAAAQRALEAGTTFEGVLAIVRELREGSDGAPPSELPIALMGYANPFVRRGFDAATRALKDAGGDALLVADMPAEEGEEMARAANDADLCPIFFAAPTSPDERIALAARRSRGFLYAIGRVGVTGRATDMGADTVAFLERARRIAGDLPVAVGFGIAGPDAVRVATGHADLAIVGSALVQHLHEAAGSAPEAERPALAAAAARAFTEHLLEGVRR